jgi:predicted 3-demethylubiquinone-9 3-methyltransferase (glyoxalase superfamily)
MAAGAKFTTFLAFDSGAEEALDFYASVFDDVKVHRVIRAAADEPGWTEGTLQHAVFTLAGTPFMCINVPKAPARGHDHAQWERFGFSPSTAVYVQCASEEEFDRVFAALSEKGEVLMPVGTYGFSRKFGWVTDRFGLSWRINLSRDTAPDTAPDTPAGAAGPGAAG